MPLRWLIPNPRCPVFHSPEPSPWPSVIERRDVSGRFLADANVRFFASGKRADGTSFFSEPATGRCGFSTIRAFLIVPLRSGVHPEAGRPDLIHFSFFAIMNCGILAGRWSGVLSPQQRQSTDLAALSGSGLEAEAPVLFPVIHRVHTDVTANLYVWRQ